ncbi:DUF885 domain-containing protein [Altererythrobacter sp. Root672]|uniref:DUF885 domain-containing protein n=1 Tax=Altererythrobacter sp. Root672 TaxID=1736584 RepID=UPI0006FA6F10|nr:DUF885 family protein [Altererythrobacter sp. Root672]KRA83714.1 Tat pathway signal protein [Altererythrobacter sp. Root672]
MKRRQFLVSTGAAAIAASVPWPAFAQTQGDAALRDVIDRTFRGDMLLSPQSMTSLGLDTGADAAMRSRLDRTGPAAERAGADHARKMLAEVKAISPKGLSETWQVRRELVEYLLGKRLISEPFGIQHVGAPYRISQQDGVYFSIPDFLDSTHPVETAADAEAYLSRLEAFPDRLDEQSDNQQADAARGYLAPGWSLDLAMGQLEAQLRPAPGENNMVRSLVRRAGAKNLSGDWQARATKLVEGGVYPALRRQLELLKGLRPNTPAGDGVWRVPRGDEIYAQALDYFTTTSLSPEEIHRTGVEQVAEITAELDKLMRADGLTSGTVGERLIQLSERPDQLFPNDDGGREALIASLNHGVEAMQAKLPMAFATIPSQPLVVKRVPVEIQDGAPSGYYNVASLDGSRPAIYWINLKDTAEWPKFTLPALTYHEGVPGHHLHLSLLQQDKDLPLLLKNYWLSAHGEGWALYAEMVADELGGYTGIEKAGALQSWLFRAARLVVDTGLNAKRWTREQATDYLVANTGYARPMAQREIERYCASPGQACSYKIGQNEWVRLRRRSEQELGAKFDLRQFHEILKEGSMPLEMLDERVAAWAARVKAA